MPKRILVVDDEPANRKLLEAMLARFGYEVELASDGSQALTQLSLGFDLVLLDVMMPGMDGFEVTRRIRGGTENADIPICIVTALAAREDRLRAVEAGANDFIAKPIDMIELKIRIVSLLKLKEGQDAIKRHRAELEAMVAARTESLRQALQDTAKAQRRAYHAQLETIERLALAAEYRDTDTALHIQRISVYCHLIARRLGLSPRECQILFHACPMHDVGKIGIPDAILLKPGKLNPAEWEIMKTHTDIGARILGGSSSELLQAGEMISRTHHEKWDGSGYPIGLAGEAIPLWGRIVAVADVFDALTSTRPYKEAMQNDEAIQIMREGRGTQFDPSILDLFLAHIDEVIALQTKHRVPADARALNHPL